MCADKQTFQVFPQFHLPPTPAPARCCQLQSARLHGEEPEARIGGWQAQLIGPAGKRGRRQKRAAVGGQGGGGGNLATTPARRGAVDIPGLEQRSPQGQRLCGFFFTKQNCWRRPERWEPKEGRKRRQPGGRAGRPAQRRRTRGRSCPRRGGTARGPAGPKSRTGS